MKLLSYEEIKNRSEESYCHADSCANTEDLPRYFSHYRAVMALGEVCAFLKELNETSQHTLLPVALTDPDYWMAEESQRPDID